MPRPTTRAQLLEAAESGFVALRSLIDDFPEGAACAEFAFEDRDRNVRDVLWHLHVWHEMVIRWHREGTLEGGLPAVPGVGYTWKTLPALNQVIWEEAQSVDLSEARAAVEGSHVSVLVLISAHTDEELFTCGLYPWTKSTTLGAYFISATSSHYDWALKKLRKHKRTYGERCIRASSH